MQLSVDKTRVTFAVLHTELIWSDQERSEDRVTPKSHRFAGGERIVINRDVNCRDSS